MVVGNNIFNPFFTFASLLMKTENTKTFYNIMLFSTLSYIQKEISIQLNYLISFC